MTEMLEKGSPLPFELLGAAVFYAAPTPAPPGRICGSVGPTTSLRMDPFTMPLINAGVRIFIGKGPRGAGTSRALAESGSVYLAAAGGTAALGGRCVERCGILAWEDLGAEAVYSMALRDYPVFVAQDVRGGNIYGRGNPVESHGSC
jgi:fumarate hydratase subunit beta